MNFEGCRPTFEGYKLTFVYALVCMYIIPAVVVIVEISCSLMLVTTLPLLAKQSLALTVAKLKVVWVSPTVVAQLVGCDSSEILLSGFITGVTDDVWGESLILAVEHEYGKSVVPAGTII